MGPFVADAGPDKSPRSPDSILGGPSRSGLGRFDSTISRMMQNRSSGSGRMTWRDLPLSRLLLAFFLLSGIVLSLTACSPDGAGPANTPTPTAAEQNNPTPAPSPLPTPTETALPERLLFLTPAGADESLVAELKAILESLSSSAGLVLESIPEIRPEDLTPETRLIVALPPAPGLEELASRSPETLFLGIGIPELQPATNVSVIGGLGFRPDQQAFLAGYMAAMLTDDWRVGVISAGGTAEGRAARQGFLNGVVFYCGLCRPEFPPFVLYPTFSEIGDEEGENAWRAAADALIGDAVKTVYLFPGIDNQDIRTYLREAGIGLIGGPDGEEGAQSGWIARVVPDPGQAVTLLWPGLMAGESGHDVPMPLAIRDIDPALLSPGRQQLMERVISDLLEGVTDTGVDPLTGDPR
jgi:hypothetical protein